MPTRPDLSICLPACNEEQNLAPMLEHVVGEIAPRCPRFEVVVVDDGSDDATPAVLERLAATYPQLRVLRHPHRRGYGAAARTALAGAEGELLLLTDADLQFQLADVDLLLREIPSCDLAIGYRSPRADPLLRTATGGLWTATVNLLFGYTARDVNCAFKLSTRSAFAAIAGSLRSDGATFSAEWLIRARHAGLTVREVPVRHRPRRAGNPSGLRPRVVARALRELFRLRLELWRR